MKALLKLVVTGLMFTASSAFADKIVIERTTTNNNGTIYVAVWLPINSANVGPVSNTLLGKQAAKMAQVKGCGADYAMNGSNLVSEQIITGRTDLSASGILKYYGFTIRCDYGYDLVQSGNMDVSR